MLIITRRIGERVMIGDTVTVTIIGLHGMQVRLGISAPKDVPVDREEVRQRKNREKQSAAEYDEWKQEGRL